MQSNIIKLPDHDGSMRYQRFCPNCSYWLFGEDIGSKYCPHCGVSLIWNSEKADLFHQTNYKLSLKKYSSCKEHQNNRGINK